MILVDTSIWIDHLRGTNATLVALLQTDAVCVHPFIIGELACGNLGNRKNVLELLNGLPQLMPANDDEVLHFIDKRSLMGRGNGYIDMHLLAACVLHMTSIWTRDKRLSAVAEEFGLAYRTDTH